jgi:hypothetical protein
LWTAAALGDRLPFSDRHLALAIITRPDPWGYGALRDVFQRYAVGALVTSGQPTLDPQYAQLVDAFQGTVTQARRGQQFAFTDGVTLDILSPEDAGVITDDQRASAVVAGVSYGDVRILLGGEAEADLLRELQACCGDRLGATVAQTVPGFSVPDASFWTGVGPQVLVVHSRNDAQAQDAAPALQALVPDAALVNTIDGHVHVWTDGTTYWFDQ